MGTRSSSYLFLIVLLISVACPADDSSDAGPLRGIWGFEREFGPAARGELSIDGRAAEWQARIAGYVVSVQRTGDQVSVALPDDQGAFRGHLSADGRDLVGHWIQPPTVTGGVRYATPVQLKMSPDHAWHGDVRPLDDRLALYLVVQSAPDGGVRAFLRDPDRNSGMGRAFTVSRTGDRLTLKNSRDGGDRMEGSYDSRSDRLTLNLSELGAVEFSRRTRDSALGFYPATPTEERYAYRPPVREDDGWETASLQTTGLQLDPLAALVQRILDTQTDWYTAPYIQGLLIAQHGKLVLEEYFYGFYRERSHDLRSASKTITGTLVGIALDHGARFALDSAVLRLFPEYQQLGNPDPRKLKITVQDLLTMNSGLECDDNDEKSPGNEDTMHAQTKQPDFYRYTLDLPMKNTPGDGTAVYCTAGINLLGGVVRNTSGVPLMDFFQKFFATPLDIRDYHLNLSPNGDAYMGGGIYLRPRDALKLGQLYLSGGRWRGRQVVSKGWTELATRRHSTFPASDYAAAHDYGFTWHLFEVQSNAHSYREYVAQGNGGQLIVVVPELDLAVMIDAGNYNNFPTWRKFYEELLPTYIIPAVTHAGTH
jgi:CubicO group peptidase (beta-lactamase class C family)